MVDTWSQRRFYFYRLGWNTLQKFHYLDFVNHIVDHVYPTSYYKITYLKLFAIRDPWV